jgi:chromate reductase, NAD(P)H dehydrogenase (quinone)
MGCVADSPTRMQVGIFEATFGLTTDMHDMPILRVLAICGSLRAGSSNRALVDAATLLAPLGVEVSIYQQLDRLPAFNPDLDTEVPPRVVAEFRSALHNCDAVLISSPEYAHGVPGVLKNALDWAVSSGEFIDKPVAVVNASGRATHAWKSLTETLMVMSARVVDDASITVPLDGKRLDGSGIAANADLAPVLMTAMKQLIGAVRVRRP